MNTKKLDQTLFFSMTLDFLEIYLIKEKDGSAHTRKSYREALSIFRRYVSSEKQCSIKTFRFLDCTYDFVLDYRNWLYDVKVPIGKPLMLSPAFPPASTGHATFTASGAPSSIVSAVIHTHSFTLAKSVCYDLH